MHNHRKFHTYLITKILQNKLGLSSWSQCHIKEFDISGRFKNKISEFLAGKRGMKYSIFYLTMTTYLCHNSIQFEIIINKTKDKLGIFLFIYFIGTNYVMFQGIFICAILRYLRKPYALNNKCTSSINIEIEPWLKSAAWVS